MSRLIHPSNIQTRRPRLILFGAMANYISVPIIAELVRRTEENPHDGNSVKAMASSVLSHYFPADKGYGVTAAPNRGSRSADSMMLQIKHCLPDRHIVDHMFIDANWGADSTKSSLERLQEAVNHGKMNCGRCWVLLIQGCDFHFYHYDVNRPGQARLIPWYPSARQENCFQARRANFEIDWMLRHMAQRNTIR